MRRICTNRFPTVVLNRRRHVGEVLAAKRTSWPIQVCSPSAMTFSRSPLPRSSVVRFPSLAAGSFMLSATLWNTGTAPRTC